MFPKKSPVIREIPQKPIFLTDVEKFLYAISFLDLFPDKKHLRVKKVEKNQVIVDSDGEQIVIYFNTIKQTVYSLINNEWEERPIKSLSKL